MKKGIAGAGASWILAYVIFNDEIPIPEDVQWLRESILIPLIAIALGHGYCGHRITKKKLL